MEETITASDARRQFGIVLRNVKHGDTYVVERNGEPVTAIVPLRVYKEWKRERDEFLAVSHKAQQNSARSSPDMTDDEAMALALEAVAAVRAEYRTGKE
jgi:prevent-host-death family protein